MEEEMKESLIGIYALFQVSKGLVYMNPDKNGQLSLKHICHELPFQNNA